MNTNNIEYNLGESLEQTANHTQSQEDVDHLHEHKVGIFSFKHSGKHLFLEHSFIKKLGFWSGVICLIHCLFMPLILSAAIIFPSGKDFILNPNVETALIGVTWLLAWPTVISAYKYSNKKFPLLFVSIGTVGVLATHFSSSLSHTSFTASVEQLSMFFCVLGIWISNGLPKFGKFTSAFVKTR